VTTAGLGRRVTAALVDLVILSAVFVFSAIAFGDTTSANGTVHVGLTGAPFVLFVVFALAYYGVLEAATGRTPGKFACRVRVMGEDGLPAGGRAIAVRTVLRLIDGLPFAYLVGFVCILATGERRARIGDLAGRTAVVDD
jgi:uncharacterized RDD family membrane protein YckC